MSAELPSLETPAEMVEERSVTFHLRDLLGAAPQTRVDPMQLPVEAMIKVPVSLIEPQLASGSVSVSLGELARFAEPSHAPVLQAGNSDAQVSLPDNDLFHQISDLSPRPRPNSPAPEPESALEQESPSAESPAIETPGFGEPAGNAFATPFSEQAQQDDVDLKSPMPGLSGPGELSEAAFPDPLSPTIPNTPESPFGQMPKDETAQPPDFPSNPFAPLQRSESQTQEEPGTDEVAGNFFGSSQIGMPMPADDSESAEKGPEEPEPEQPQESQSETQLPSFDALIPQQGSENEAGSAERSNFFEELEASARKRHASAEPSIDPLPPELPPVDDEIVSDVELRAVFGSNESFDSQKVADLSSELPGIAACVITGPRGAFQGRNGADPAFAERAETLVRSVRDFAQATGIPNAEAFTMHTDQGAISLFVSGEDRCLAVRHEPGGFDPGVREKLILVARGLAGLN